MGLDHWDLFSHLPWLPTMEDMEEEEEEVVMGMGEVVTGMAEEIIKGRDTVMMIEIDVGPMWPRGILKMKLEETLILIPNRRKTHVFASMVILMKRKMTGKDRNNWNSVYHY